MRHVTFAHDCLVVVVPHVNEVVFVAGHPPRVLSSNTTLNVGGDPTTLLGCLVVDNVFVLTYASEFAVYFGDVVDIVPRNIYLLSN